MSDVVKYSFSHLTSTPPFHSCQIPFLLLQQFADTQPSITFGIMSACSIVFTKIRKHYPAFWVDDIVLVLCCIVSFPAVRRASWMACYRIPSLFQRERLIPKTIAGFEEEDDECQHGQGGRHFNLEPTPDKGVVANAFAPGSCIKS